MKTQSNPKRSRSNRVAVFSPWLKSGFMRLFGIQLDDRRPVYRRNTVLGILLAGSSIFLSLLVLLLLLNLMINGYSYLVPRVIIGAVLLVYVVAAALLLRHGFLRSAALMVMGLYLFIATLTVIWWSITAPFGLLLFGFCIVLSGTILGSRFTIPTAFVVVLTLGIVQFLTDHGHIVPDRAPVIAPPSPLDVGGFGTVFIIIALVAWISGRQMERSLTAALKAESALLAEKQNLAAALKERTEKLRAAQLQEMQQLYRFAELGQLSTALLHDLANHLTVLTLDIEDIQKRQHSRAISRARESILYLDKMVEQVRAQLQGESCMELFSPRVVIQETISSLKAKLLAAGIVVQVDSSKAKVPIQLLGDPTRFQQVCTILVGNAIDAYKGASLADETRSIVVRIVPQKQYVVIAVKDHGLGISRSERQKLFKPFHSTKEDGMGIGLFIARQIVETHFKGSIVIADSTRYTEFILKLPRVKADKR